MDSLHEYYQYYRGNPCSTKITDSKSEVQWLWDWCDWCQPVVVLFGKNYRLRVCILTTSSIRCSHRSRSNTLMTIPWEFKSGAFWDLKHDMISRERGRPFGQQQLLQNLGGDFGDFGTKNWNLSIHCQGQDLMPNGKNDMDIRSHLLLLSRARIHLQKMMNNSLLFFWPNPGCWMSNLAKEVANTWSYERLMRSRARIALIGKV